VQRLSQRLNLRLSGRNRRCSRRHWELSPLHFSPLSGRAAAFTIRLRLQWRKVLCAPPAAKSAGKSLAGSSEESLAAVGGEDNSSHGHAGRSKTSHSDLATTKIAGHAKRIRRFESFSVYGVGAALAPSFLPPLPAFTSTLVADIV